MKIEDLKIKVKPKYYFGYLQGYTVSINGKKFPTKRNYVYAHNEDNKAIKTALMSFNKIRTYKTATLCHKNISAQRNP